MDRTMPARQCRSSPTIPAAIYMYSMAVIGTQGLCQTAAAFCCHFMPGEHERPPTPPASHVVVLLAQHCSHITHAPQLRLHRLCLARPLRLPLCPPAALRRAAPSAMRHGWSQSTLRG